MNTSYAGPILQRNGMRAIFQKKGKKEQKRAKYLKILAKMYKIWIYFENGSLMRATIACMKQLTYAWHEKWPGCNRWGNGYNFNPLMHNVRWPDTLWKFAANAARCLETLCITGLKLQPYLPFADNEYSFNQKFTKLPPIPSRVHFCQLLWQIILT